MLVAGQLLECQVLWVAQEVRTDVGLWLRSRQPGLCCLCSQLAGAALRAGVGAVVWPCSLRSP